MSLYKGKFGDFYASNSALSKSEQEVNATYIYKAMSTYGWTLNAICGMLGNMQSESTINPARWQGGVVKDSKGYGLVQWTPSTNFRSWSTSTDENELMDEEISRIKWEHDNGKQFYKTSDYPLTFKQFVISKESAYYLARVFGRNYERSGAILSGGDAAEKSLNSRGNNANNWYSYFTGEKIEEQIVEFIDFTGSNCKINTSKDKGLNLWSDINKSESIIEVRKNEVIYVKEDLNNGWVVAEYSGKSGYVDKQYLVQTDEEVASVEEQDGDGDLSKTISAKDLIAEFYKMLGWKYEWGAARTGVVDCSGAFTYAFKQLGSWMYHGSNTMYKKYSYDNGKLGTVELLPGMAVYKWRSTNDYHHVGLYIGAGLVIEAKGSKYGVVVSRVKDWHYAGKLKSKDGTIVNYDVAEFTPQSFVGTVNTSGSLNMRSATETVSSNLIKKLSSGSTVDVLDIEVDSGWYAIKDNGTLGFVMQKYINKSNESLPDTDVEDDDENNTPDSEDNSGKDIRTVISKKVPLNVRTGPATSYEDIGDLAYGSTVVVLEDKGTWSKIEWEDGTAWCSNKYLEKL